MPICCLLWSRESAVLGSQLDNQSLILNQTPSALGSQPLVNTHMRDTLEIHSPDLPNIICAHFSPLEDCEWSHQGKGVAGQKDIMTVILFFRFSFCTKQSIYSSVFQHKYIRKELYYILLGTKKVMKAELTDSLHLLYALTF